MLQRLHKLHIQEECQSQSGDCSGICFPRLERYGSSKKDGKKTYSHFSINVSNQKVYEAMKTAELRAQESMEKLCMADELKNHKFWNTPPVPTHLLECTINENSDEEDIEEKDRNEEYRKEEDRGKEEDVNVSDDESIVDPFVSSADNITSLVEDIHKLYTNKAVDIMVKAKVEKLRKTMPFTKIETQDIGITLYKTNKTSNSGLDHTSDNLKSPFVEVEIAERDSIYIRKQTAIF